MVMFTFTRCTIFLRQLECAYKSAFDIRNLVKMMQFPGRRLNGPPPPPTPHMMRRPYYEVAEHDYGCPPDYDYDYEPHTGTPDYDHNYERHGRPLNQVDERWPVQRDLLPKRPVSVNCGELRVSDRGARVHMTGRVQFQRLNRFISLRDSHGTTQLVALEERLDLIKRVSKIPVDSHIEIIGIVQKRPLKTENTTMATGEIEVIIEEILDVAAPKRKNYELSGEEAPGRTGKKARSSVLITSGEISRCDTPAVTKRFQERTHNCGELNEYKVNLDVTLCGWIESKRSDRFVILRDGYGSTQLVISPNITPSVSRVVQSVEPNTIVVVKGKVSMRPSHQRNTRMATGNIEVKVSSMEAVDPNEPVTGGNDASDTTKMEVDESASSGPSAGDVNSYCARSHTCGQLRGGDVGQEVVLCGWLDSTRTNRFATVRDGHGYTQLLVPPHLEATLGKEMSQTNLESVITVRGTVCARPPEQINQKVPTGEIEVVVSEFSLLNPAKKNLPFIIREHNRPKEHLRMKYRYIDMRFSDMQHRLRLRSQVLMRMREFLINQRGFVEVETPTLFRRTPGGAQEFVVPTRSEDKFYSLVQSPQQLKQLLMVGAMDRYFQVARCYRDEGARPDRQPEFTQMDIELSFTDRDSVVSLVEDLVKACWPEELKPLTTPFPVLTYHDSMHQYGTDKPDLSFDKKLIDISELITDSTKSSLPSDLQNVENFTAKALAYSPNDAVKIKNAIKECEEQPKIKEISKAKLFTVKYTANNWKQAISGALPFVDPEQLKTLVEFPVPGTLVIGIGKESEVLPLLGKVRLDVHGSKTTNFNFAWIVDFPLFLEGDDGSLESAHHPFTQPHPDDTKFLDSDPLKVKGLHYDLVLNGHEVGGGSIRIHDPAMQTKVLKDILKLPVDTLDHLLEALDSGAPPHGGIALGIDRLLSIMVRAESIRDVIAFPKGVDGKDPLSGAPCSISDEERKMYHLPSATNK